MGPFSAEASEWQAGAADGNPRGQNWHAVVCSLARVDRRLPPTRTGRSPPRSRDRNAGESLQECRGGMNQT